MSATMIPSPFFSQVLPPVGMNYLTLLKALLCWDAVFMEALYPDTNAHTLINLIPRSCADKQAREVSTELDFAFQPVHHACVHEVTSATGGTRVELWTSGFEGGYQLGNEFGYQLDADDWDPRRQNEGSTDHQNLSRVIVSVPPPGADEGVGKAEIEMIRATDKMALDFLEAITTPPPVPSPSPSPSTLRSPLPSQSALTSPAHQHSGRCTQSATACLVSSCTPLAYLPRTQI